MKLYKYVITRDFGFAPNPYYGYCTLATCKPQIRHSAQIGDWVMAFGGKDTIANNKLVYIMKVSEKLTFNQYWNDERFNKKKPNFTKSRKACYGDNIYHRNDKLSEWIQENSHHSYENGETNFRNLNKDTSKDYVLISKKFWYFGNNACVLPENLQILIHHGRAYKIENDEKLISSLIQWLESTYSDSINGVPFSLKDIDQLVRFKGDPN